MITFLCVALGDRPFAHNPGRGLNYQQLWLHSTLSVYVCVCLHMCMCVEPVGVYMFA